MPVEVSMVMTKDDQMCLFYYYHHVVFISRDFFSLLLN